MIPRTPNGTPSFVPPVSRKPHGVRFTWNSVAWVWAATIFYIMAINAVTPAGSMALLAVNAFAGIVTLPFLARGVRLVEVPLETVLFLAFIAWSAVTVLLSGDISPQSQRWLGVLARSWILFAVLTVVVVRSRRSGLLLLSVVAAALWATLELYVFRGGSPSTILDGLRDFDRGDSPNYFGFLAALGIVSLFGLYPRWSHRPAWTVVAAAVIAGLFFGIVASASRAALLLVALFIPLWLLICLPRSSAGWLRRAAFAAAFAAALLVAVPWVQENTFLGERITRISDGTDASFDARWSFLMIGFDLFLENPIAGVGLGNFRYVSGTNMQSHSELAEVLSSTGVVGAALYYSIFVVLLRRLRHARRRLVDPEQVYLSRFVGVAVVAFVVVSAVTAPSFLSPHRVAWLAVLVGTSMSLSASARARELPTQTPNPGLRAR